MFFEDIGFTYLGPVDGHDIEKLESILHLSKGVEGPVLVHVITKKGKGYEIAEKNPAKFHGVSSFDIKTGEVLSGENKDYSKVFGEKLCELAKEDENIVAITAAMKDGTGLSKFAAEYPKRFFDVGIAEQHAVGLIAGMAKAGLKPVFAVYSSFLQRSYDQLIHDIAIQKLSVVICVDRAGVVGADGETHQGIFDLSYLATIPNMNILAPKNFDELEKMLEFGIKLNEPVSIRYPRGAEAKVQFSKTEDIVLGKAELLQEGRNITIVAIGKMVARAQEVVELLKNEGIECEIINARFLKPIDKETILDSVRKTKYVITIEDNSLEAGLGAAVTKVISDSECKDVSVKTFGYPDVFVQHGKAEELEKLYELDSESIACEVRTMLQV